MQSKFARDMMAQKLMSENKDNPFNSRFFQPSDAMAAPTRQGFSNLLSKMEQRDKQGTDVFPALAMGSGFVPSAGISDVLGFAPDPFNKGQTLPSFSENIDKGRYLDAGLQTVGAGGDLMLAASPFAPFLLAPAVGMKLTSQLGKTLRGGSKATETSKLFKSVNKFPSLSKSEETLVASSSAPVNEIAGLGRVKIEKIDPNDMAGSKKRFDELKALTSGYKQDRAKAKIIRLENGENAIQYMQPPTEVKKLNISELIATQDNVVLGTNKTAGDVMPLVVKKDGKFFIRDGHHRIAQNINSGDKTADVRVIDLDKGGFLGVKATKTVDDVKPGDIAKVVPPTDKSDGIFAFHGSGADFDEFKLSKIGTGEGHQAFGYGLYFTDSKDIAKFYKTHLSKEVDIDGKPFIRGNKHYPEILKNESLSDNLSSTNGDLEKAIKYIEETVNEMKELKNVNGIETYSKELKDLKQLRGKVKVRENTGKTYEVNIKTVKDDLLDYDKPLSEQPKIYAKLEKYFGARDLNVYSLKNKGKDSEKLTGRELYGLLQNKLGKESMDKVRKINKKLSELNKVIDANSVGYRNFTSPVGEKAAKQYDNLLAERSKIPRGRFDDKSSDILNKLGIKGIKYEPGQLTPGGQYKTKGESNFVIFDDKIIDIMAKYGIVGAIGVSAMQRGSGATEGDILPPGNT